jgi:hypothetical protein
MPPRAIAAPPMIECAEDVAEREAREAGLRRSMVVLACLVAVVVAARTSPAHADILPHPVMRFQFASDPPPPPVRTADIHVCEDDQCAEYRSVADDRLWPWGVQCAGDACEAVKPPGDRFRLVVTFDNGTFESNVFRDRGLRSNYSVTISGDHLVVDAAASPTRFGYSDAISFLLVLAVVVAVESGVVYGYARIAGVPAPRLIWIAVANALSLFLLWFPLRLAGLPPLVYVALGESLAVVLEAAVYYRAGRSRGLSARTAAALSVAANATTFIAGLCFGFFGL